jgi:holo-[acyl-carrier protein] synthase
MEIGIDIEKNERFVDLNPKVLEKTYTENERAYAQKFVNSHEILCSLWCVKEATVKAFSNLKIPFLEIEVAHEQSGKPFIVKNATILSELEKINANEIKISISHAKDYSTAVCLIY